MSEWHTDAPSARCDTGVMLTATALAEKRTENEPSASLIEAYREHGDRRAIERIVSLNTKILQ